MDLTRDAILRGRLLLWQPRDGYRFSVDAVQLGDFAARSRYARALDLGCGCGVIGLMLALRAPRARVTGVEAQPDLAEAARRNAADNRMAARFEVVEGDLRRPGVVPAGAFDLVACNPPYHDPAAGPPSPRPARAAARHQTTCTLAEAVAAARRALAPRGRLALIVPVEALPRALAACGPDLRPTVLRFVHPHADRPARRVLIEARRGGRAALRVARPLIVHEGDGWSVEMRRVLGEDAG